MLLWVPVSHVGLSLIHIYKEVTVNYKNDFSLGTWAPINTAKGHKVQVFVDNGSAVSYTHLDVYKRQAFRHRPVYHVRGASVSFYFLFIAPLA